MSEPSGYSVLCAESPTARVRFDEPAEWILVVRVVGELDAVTVPLLQIALDARRQRTRPCRLVIDLAGVTLLSSAALGLLQRLHHDTRDSDQHLVLTGTGHPAVHRPLRVTGLLALFDTRPTATQALTGQHISRRSARSAGVGAATTSALDGGSRRR